MTMTADATDRAAWEARFRTPRTLWVARSAVRPERGLASTNRTGAYQLEQWSVETGAWSRTPTSRAAATPAG